MEADAEARHIFQVISWDEEENMKKVFISCPMKGRTTENIQKTMDKMHKCAPSEA